MCTFCDHSSMMNHVYLIKVQGQIPRSALCYFSKCQKCFDPAFCPHPNSLVSAHIPVILFYLSGSLENWGHSSCAMTQCCLATVDEGHNVLWVFFSWTEIHLKPQRPSNTLVNTQFNPWLPACSVSKSGERMEQRGNLTIPSKKNLSYFNSTMQQNLQQKFIDKTILQQHKFTKFLHTQMIWW